MGDVLDVVAFDIETTGFSADDEVTVIGFELDLGVRVFLETPTGERATEKSARGTRDASCDTPGAAMRGIE